MRVGQWLALALLCLTLPISANSRASASSSRGLNGFPSLPMGAGQSTTAHAQPPSRALHVLRVTPASPASQTNIEPFFDFVVGFEGDSLSSRKNIDAAELERIVESHEGKSLNLLVWNNKTQATRVISITPSRAWSQPYPPAPNPRGQEAEPQPSLLGLSMRMCEPEFAVDNVWHVLDVLEGSPAESAGLVPYGDWIIGWSGGVLSAEGDFYDVVEAHVDKPLRVYVYSYDFDTIREVVLVPNRQWGGEGLLGCVFGFGLLHRIPALPVDRQPGAIPLELHDDVNEYEEQDLFVPADATGHDLHGTSRLNHDHDSFAIDHSGSKFGQDYSYTFSNRGVATQPSQNRHLASSTIREEQEPAGVPVASASELSGPPHHAHWHSSSRQPVETTDTHMQRAPTPTSAPPSTNGFLPLETSHSVSETMNGPENRTGSGSHANGINDTDETDDDFDGQESIAGTESTEVESEVTSDHGSLTSVE